MKTAFCFDMDGTLTKQELLPIIAREASIEPEMSVLTKATIDGILPFENSLSLRVKLLSSLSIEHVNSIIMRVVSHELMVEFIKQNQENCFVVTGNLDAWIAGYMKSIGCKFYCSKAVIEDNKVVGVKDVLNKSDAILEIKEKYGFERVVAIGDGMNDVQMFEKSDVGIAFGGVHRPVTSLMEVADYITYSEKGLCNILKML